MPILTYISDIPLFTTKTEALRYGAKTTPKMLGYHTHVHEGVTGYMAGYFHPSPIEKSTSQQETRPSYNNYLSDVLLAVNSIEEEIIVLERDKEEAEYVVDYETEKDRDRFDKIIKDRIETIKQSLEYLFDEKGRIKDIEYLVQQLSSSEFKELLDKKEIDLNIKQKTESTVQAVNQIAVSAEPIKQDDSETIVEEVVEQQAEQIQEQILANQRKLAARLRKEQFEKKVKEDIAKISSDQKLSEEDLKREQERLKKLQELERELRASSSGGGGY
tara:strand:+ start:1705 stop:2526 length:822 start_codon:yes stop_codon:yes gene_type:complete